MAANTDKPNLAQQAALDVRVRQVFLDSEYAAVFIFFGQAAWSEGSGKSRAKGPV